MKVKECVYKIIKVNNCGYTFCKKTPCKGVKLDFWLNAQKIRLICSYQALLALEIA